MLNARRGTPLFMLDGDGGAGGGTATPPTENQVGEAKRKQGEAEARARAAEKTASDLQTRLEALESKDQSEVQKLTAKVTKLESDNAALKGTIESNAKQGHVRAVAGGYNPHDVEALFKFVDLDSIASEDDAKNALEGLKSTHGFLFGDGTPAAPTPTPTPAPFGAPVNPGGVPVVPGVPVTPNGEPDVQTGIGMGLLGALDKFRSQRG